MSGKTTYNTHKHVESCELNSVNSMSFIPTMEECNQLYKHSIVVEKCRQSGERSILMSKLYKLPGKLGLCPDSLNPNETILSKLGRGDIGPGGKIGCSEILNIINDRNMPLGGGSCGPNGVLTDCQNVFGKNRINLFYNDKTQTHKLLVEYLKFRKENEINIFKMYCEKCRKCDGNYKIDPSKDIVLDPLLQMHYTNMCNMFSTLEKYLVKSNSQYIEDIGISQVSFCQTWLRKGGEISGAQFSVMSPHFQTRHIISNAYKVSVILGKNSERYFESYVTMIKHFDKIMGENYGVSGGGQAFINMDLLEKTLSNNQVMGIQENIDENISVKLQ